MRYRRTAFYGAQRTLPRTEVAERNSGLLLRSSIDTRLLASIVTVSANTPQDPRVVPASGNLGVRTPRDRSSPTVTAKRQRRRRASPRCARSVARWKAVSVWTRTDGQLASGAADLPPGTAQS